MSHQNVTNNIDTNKLFKIFLKPFHQVIKLDLWSLFRLLTNLMDKLSLI